MNNQDKRVHYGFRDMPCSGDKNAKAMTDEVCEQLASAFVIFITKGVWSSEQDMKTQFEKLVKKIIPKHNIFIHLEKKDFPDVKGHRKLNAPNIKRKQWEDVFFTMQPILYTNSYGLNEYSLLVSGCPQNIHPGTGKPKA